MRKQDNVNAQQAIVREVSYKDEIVKIIDKIHDEKLLKRIYQLAEYLYIYE